MSGSILLAGPHLPPAGVKPSKFWWGHFQFVWILLFFRTRFLFLLGGKSWISIWRTWSVSGSSKGQQLHRGRWVMSRVGQQVGKSGDLASKELGSWASKSGSGSGQETLTCDHPASPQRWGRSKVKPESQASRSRSEASWSETRRRHSSYTAVTVAQVPAVKPQLKTSSQGKGGAGPCFWLSSQQMTRFHSLTLHRRNVLFFHTQTQTHKHTQILTLTHSLQTPKADFSSLSYYAKLTTETHKDK